MRPTPLAGLIIKSKGDSINGPTVVGYSAFLGAPASFTAGTYMP
jgi:hypothetical protein